MGIRIQQLHKRFDDFTALDAIDLEIRQGELLALLGPSGSGKTTLLRIIAGLEHADGGQVLFGDEDATRMSVQSRRVGFVFQHYALFKHMSVYDNIAFGLRVRRGQARWPEARIRDRVHELLALVQLQGLEKRYPTQLSGGQRQRVAIARALATAPRVIVCDEAVSALDVSVQAQVLDLLAELQAQLGLACLFISHDLGVIRHISDDMLVMRQGRVLERGPVEQVFTRPRHDYTRQLLAAVPPPLPARARLA